MAEPVREIVAELRADHRNLDKRVDSLEKDLESKHKENRAAIHSVRGAIDKVGTDVHLIDKRLSKAVGYGMGAGAATGVFVAVIVEIIHHYWK